MKYNRGSLRNRKCHKESLAVLLLLIGLKASAASFQGLGDLSGGSYLSVATGVSADGTIVCGYGSSGSGYQAFRWTAATGLVGLGDLPGGGSTSYAEAVSADGSTIVGYSGSALGSEAFRWDQTAGMQGLGDLPGGSSFSYAYGVSANGEVIVGYSYSESSGTRPEAFRWTAATGMVGLGDLPGGDYTSRAWAVSGDGSVVVGETSSANGTEAFRWTAASGMVGLGDFPGGIFNSIAYSISADGLVIVGRGYSGAYNDYTHEAFRWTAGTGLSQLGFLPCNTWSIAHAASADGSVIAGDPESNSGDCAFIWDAQHGIRSLHAVLSDDCGVQLAGWQLSGVRGISADGKTLVGFGINPSGQTEAWIASVAPPRLAIRRSGNSVLVSWPTNSASFVLQSASELAPTSWTDCNEAPTISGTEFQLLTPVTNHAQFYRLKK